MIPYTTEDIKRCVSIKFYIRGETYYQCGRVKHVEVNNDGDCLRGLVEGSVSKAYQVHVNLVEHGPGVLLGGNCSCPVGINCKHVAALLLAGLEFDSTGQLETIVTSQDKERIKDRQIAAWMEEIEKSVTATDDYPAKIKKRLLYLLDVKKDDGIYKVIVNPSSVNVLKKGGFGKVTSYNPANMIDFRPAKFLLPDDITILKRLLAHNNNTYLYRYVDEYSLEGKEGAQLLEEMLSTGRCYWREPENNPLSLGEERQGKIKWDMAADGTQHITCDVEQGADYIFSLMPLYYFDPARNCCGKINTCVSPKLANTLLQAPPLKHTEIEVVREKLFSHLKDINVELPRVFNDVCNRKITPVPHLYLTIAYLQQRYRNYNLGYGEVVECPVVQLSFYYGDTKVGYGDYSSQVTGVEGDKLIYIKRDESSEKSKVKSLKKHGLTSIRELGFSFITNEENLNFFVMLNGYDMEVDTDNADLAKQWLEFTRDIVPKLRNEGWRVEIDPSFPYNIVEPDDEWYTEIDEFSGIDWFGVELGVVLDGERLNLLPILLDSLKKNPNIFEDGFPDEGKVLYKLPDGRKLALPSDRVRTILTFLKDLYNFENLDTDGRLRLSRLEAVDLTDLEAALEAVNMRWFGGERVKRLGRMLRDFSGIIAVAPPGSLKTKLRPYQEEGLSWLQFLREYGLAGILADDMGLGKTVQTLAYLALEKENNRLDKPALVISPTSVLVNWRLEAERFTPNLKVLTLHGTDRKAHYSKIKKHDIVLTTYPLLPRDKDELLKEEYHTVILDEAQFIKNPKTKIAQVACQLKADYRLCLTGTPMENHLGELWSLFNFLLPGLLGDERQFRQFYRKPIEKEQNDDRRKALVRRIKPFMLRRTKDKVAAELPPKTEIIQTSELAKSQRDLYETIRISMHEKVRKEIASRGLARSHIIVLDALLKLRQVCCDPRLLNIEAAKRIKYSVKLEQLMEMLPELLEEGRKILLFSQFVSMLKLIEAELKGQKMEYVKLTGQTKDRQTPINSFQNGDVPIFLISLRAGGTGLNLTAADTVIHYDPWWNPAVENQATDRAHRIGQNKPVFVYKLITAGTVEEKIIQLQEKKRALAEGIFNPESKAANKLTVEDINALFEPIGQ